MMESLTALLYLLLHYLLPQAVLGWISLMEYPATSSKLSRPFQNTFTLSNSMRIRKHSIKILCKKISKAPWSHLFHSKSFYSLALVLCFLCGLSTERAFGLQLLPPLLTRYHWPDYSCRPSQINLQQECIVDFLLSSEIGLQQIRESPNQLPSGWVNNWSIRCLHVNPLFLKYHTT